MHVAAVQYCGRTADKAACLVELASLVRECKGADLVVLPELAATGYVLSNEKEARAISETPRGPTFAALAPVASEIGSWLVVGFVEASGERLFNSALVVNPKGELEWVYRKTLLFDADKPWATPGDTGYKLFETAAGNFTVGICMDLNDDQFTEWIRTSGARAVAFPTNWLLEKPDSLWPSVWHYWAARMMHASAALVAANTYGPEADIAFCGRSAVLDRNVLLAHAEEKGTEIVRATLPSL